MKTFILRIMAFILDMGLVFLLTSLICFFNPNKDAINKCYHEIEENEKLYQKVLKEYKSVIGDDGTITYEEQDVMMNRYSYYASNFLNGPTSKTLEDDVKKTKDDYFYQKRYEIEKKSIFNNVVFIILAILYFGIFAYFFKCQTIFKRIFRLKIVSDYKISLLNMIIRSILITGILINFINIILILVLKESAFISCYKVIEVIKTLYPVLFLAFLIFKDDEASLHDYLLKTKVCRYNKKGKIIESKIF